MKKEKNKRQKRIQGTSNDNGITLVALVITIIIIIILSTVTLNMAFGDKGLIKQAQLAKDLTANSMSYEAEATANLVSYMNEMLEGNGEIVLPDTNEVEPPQVILPKVEEVKGGDAFSEKTTIEDVVGNKIEVPGGFRVSANSGNTVQQGIVIEDVSASTDEKVQGSQFVWIPVGVFIKDNGVKSNNIILGRYTFADDGQGTPELQQPAYIEENPENYNTSKVISSYYTELSTYRVGVASDVVGGSNTTAINLKNWVNSVKVNGGYYIGRYEASFASGTSIDNYKAASKESITYSETVIPSKYGALWNQITQINASKVAINTYSDSKSVKSDLINSYAWDTAIVFIQEAGNKNYAKQNSKNIILSNTGTNGDEVCKINDIGSNAREWTTEASNYLKETNVSPCTSRGANYSSVDYTSDGRYSSKATFSTRTISFRISLYF